MYRDTPARVLEKWNFTVAAVYDRRYFLEGAMNEFAECIPLPMKEG